MVEDREQQKRLGWFLSLRLALYVILFAVVVARMGYPEPLHLPFILYSILTLASTVLLAVDGRRRAGAVSTVLIGLQFALEIVVECGVIYASGGVNSPFTALYLLTIVSAALTYRLVGTLVVASLVSAGFTFLIWLGLGQDATPAPILEALDALLSAQDSVFYAIFLHILIFYLVAFVSGYLAERLRVRDRQLADTSRELRQAKLETDDILRRLNSGLLTVDAQGRIVFFNRAAERILGFREQDVRGMMCHDVFAERMPSLAEAIADGISRRIVRPRKEIRILDGDGRPTPLGLSTSTLTGENGELRGLIAIFSDLTEAKRLEAKVRAADRLAAIGELSASIAHEIRNPLAAISGSVEVLRNELHPTGENERLMQLIVKESDRLSKILSEFLTYARIDRATYAKVELCHLVGEVIQLLHHHPSFTEGLDVQFETDESIVYVVGDEDLIKQLLLNLAVNACEALQEDGGRLTMRLVAAPESGVIELHIQDNGPGIPPEHQKRIYEPFFSTKKQGTGLGLAIVHRVCAALRLDIRLDSRVGEGTTFLIEFEAFRPDKAEQQTSTPTVSEPVTVDS